MSDLPTRIAALLYTRFAHALGYADAPWDSVDHEPWLEDADAVIAELGLEKRSETGEINDRDGGKPIKYGRYRYVTDWTPTKPLRDPDMIAADAEWQAKHPEEAE